ncbi:hypothetical protein MILUP08_43362 [Micromonospora lupini str. Lupac 08]|uniref:Uncharacterized protein n=1 Tax=Micromonospora lupini str. Lupac 08 TaxID=1150864 RepID=I0L3Q5_9ACTN|nr:hypothetical protein MILUP08_43362 [Micromonospora lupini str. Lupac 08]
MTHRYTAQQRYRLRLTAVAAASPGVSRAVVHGLLASKQERAAESEHAVRRSVRSLRCPKR